MKNKIVEVIVKNKILGWKSKQINLAVITTDKEYLEDLEDFFSSNPETGILIKWSSNADELPEETLIPPDIDVLLVDIKLIENHQELPAWLEQRRLIVLTETVTGDWANNFPQLQQRFFYKYAPGSLLVEKIYMVVSGITVPRSEVIISKKKTDDLEDQTLVLTIHSPQGGSGKTTVAVNLALLYAQKGIKTILIDLSMYGAVSALLQIPQKGKGLSSIITLLEQMGDLAAGDKLSQRIESSKYSYDLKGNILDVLVSAAPMSMEKMTFEYTQLLIDQLAKDKYQVIVIDTSSELSSRVLGALSKSDRGLIVVTPDNVGAWKVMLLLEILKTIAYPREKLYLIINKYDQTVEFNIDDFISSTGLACIGEIPQAYQQIQGFANRGIPMAAKGSYPVTIALKQIAHKLRPVFKETELKDSFLKKLWRQIT